MNVLWSFAQVKAEHFAYRRYRVRSNSTMRSSGIVCKLQIHYEEQWKQYNYKDKEIIVKGLEKLNQFLDAIMRKENMR